MKKLENLLKDYKYGKLTSRKYVNYRNIPVTCLDVTEENAKIFNEILDNLKRLNLFKLVRTPSGGISKTVKNFRIPSYDYSTSNSGAELIILLVKGFYRIQFRHLAKADNGNVEMTGRTAFETFRDLCADKGINLSKYAISNGYEVKNEISKPLIKVERDAFLDKIFRNAHHIDFHNSYPAGLVNTHPEFKELITELYEKRKENKVYKAVLNYTIGFMQSKWTGYRYTNLARDAINDNNKRIIELSERLRKTGHTILAYNTDGIWYLGDEYHGEGEGDSLGQWHNDHNAEQIRFKSAGSYEFIENGEYHPVVRGYTTLDRELDRTEWKWGDIYTSGVIQYAFNENGIILVVRKDTK